METSLDFISDFFSKKIVERTFRDFLNENKIDLDEDGNFREEDQVFFRKVFGNEIDSLDSLVYDFKDMVEAFVKIVYALVIDKEKLEKQAENMESKANEEDVDESTKIQMMEKIMSNSATKELLTKKSVKVTINQVTKPKTNILLSYFFNQEESIENKDLFIGKEFNSQIQINQEEFMIIIKLHTLNPLETKIHLENFIQNLLKTVLEFEANSENSLTRVIVEGFSFNYYTGSDHIIVTIQNKAKIISIFHSLCKNFSNLLKKFKLYLNFNLSFEKSFEDLTYPNEGLLKTFAEGIKTQLEVSSNLSNGFAELIKIFKNSDYYSDEDEFDFTYLLTLLNFNVDLQISKGDLEDNRLWKKIPDINIFDSENELLAEMIKFEAKIKESFAFIYMQGDELLKNINSKIQICLHSPAGMINLKLEAKGLHDTWQTLITIHKAGMI